MTAAPDRTGAPALEIDGARKVYRVAGGGRTVVSDVSLRVMPGTIHGLLGPNGAGKTTTLKMLMGLVRPTAGRFELMGRPAAEAGARSSAGFLSEQPYFPAQLTVAGVLKLCGRLSGLDRAAVADRSAYLLERVGIPGTERTAVSKLSRGMLQRLGLAQALIAEPAVLVLDEPASGLDPVGQRDIRGIMLELRSGGTAVLLSSHQLSEVEAVCDEVTILDRGVVAARGSIDDLLNVSGRTAVRAAGEGGSLPEAVASVVEDVAFTGGVWAFSVADRDVRRVVDALDDAGWSVIAVTPKRDSLEDYFSALLAADRGEER